MTTNKQLIIITALVIIIFTSVIRCWKNDRIYTGNGGCQYENFKDTIVVDTIIYEGNSIDYVNFRSVDNPKEIYQENSYDLSFRIGKEFTEKEIKDTLSIFCITGERITRGCCTPYSIKEMKLLK